ncbi:phage tail protein [Bacillus cereus]|nr:phage tail protein [Bacillus cereus]
MSCFDVVCLDGQDYFTFGGQRSTDFGLFIVGERDFSSSDRDVKQVKILGKDGDCIIDQGRNENYERKLECYLVVKDWRKLHSSVSTIKNWLHRDSKYKELTLSYEEGAYYVASMVSKIDAKMIDVQIASVQITFTVKPFKYSHDSFVARKHTEAFNIYNPDTLWALPYIKVVGSGDINLHIGANTYALKNVDGYIELDSELQIVYKKVDGIINNRSDRMRTRWFPNFKEGDNAVSWTGNVSSIEVIPRWRSR